jgi:hypothetical protein
MPSARTLIKIICLAGFAPVVSYHSTPAAEARWWKGNTHTHSLWSDGNDFPEMITDWYQKHGYQFLAISDHNVLQAKEVWMSIEAAERRRKALGKTTMEKYTARFGGKWVETREEDGVKQVRLKKLAEYRPLFEKPGEFLLVEAEEISASFSNAAKAKVPVHIGAVNPGETIKPVGGTSIRDVLRQNLQAIRDQEKRLGQPILAHVNHPNFQWALTAEDLAEAVEENFVEVFNGHPGIHFQGDAQRPGAELVWDIANTLRIGTLHAHPLFGMGTDDAHHYHGEEVSPGRSWIMVHAAELKAGALIEAMRAGDFYASSGVTLDELAFKDGTLHLRIRGEPGVNYTTRIIGTLENYDHTVREVPSPQGDPHPVRLAYPADVGKTLATIEGTVVNYRLTGKELYIRALVTSTKPHPNPAFASQTEAAWTQPVGWERRVSAR